MKGLLLTVLIIFSYCLTVAAQTDFDSAALSDNGLKAYQTLISAQMFTVGPVGIAASYSKEEKALHTLLKEKLAEDACLSLVGNANYEGGLYGLLGLRFLKSEMLGKANEEYRLRPMPPERVIGIKTVAQGEIITMRGCFFIRVKVVDVLTRLKDGALDKEFESNGKPTKTLREIYSIS